MKKRVIMNLFGTLVILMCMTGCQSDPVTEMEGHQQTIETENTKPTLATEPFQSAATTETQTNTEPVDTEPVVEISISTEPIVEESTDPPVVDDEILVNIIDYIPNAVIDLKYATTDNFTEVQIYDSEMKAQLRYGTMKKLMLAQEKLNELGYVLVIWDAYRPTEAQFKLWNVCPNATYVANPYKGFSSHSRGNTVDITIQALDGRFVEMPTEFDDFSLLANRDYSDVSDGAASNALMLENIMKECGFKPYFGEWWHFSDIESYPVVE